MSKDKYVKLTQRESSRPCYYHRSALDGLIEEIESADVGDTYSIEIIELTKEEFNALPDWGGW